jgi:alpha-L-fucosidase 2
MSLKLGNESGDNDVHNIVLKSDLPTDERLEALKNGEEDPELFATYFMYGRYLLFASSRGTCLPANLQGVWNNSMTPPWESKYTININAQMNYWIAESGNLSDCHMPFFELLKRVCENGKKTAEKMYGCRGSVAHHNTDIYADTAPQDHCISSTFWIMGEAWMATHIWEHYLYTGDRKFLNEHFYILDECVTFFKDFLIRNEEGKLVTSPSISPENVYIMNNGVRGCMCEAPTMDIEILTELLTDYIKAGQTLDIDEKKIKDAKDILADLPEIKIGRYGQIQEWLEDYDEQEPGHRHISHLYGVYPGTSISIDKTPELMKAARKTLERRLSYGGGHTGWSRAWIIGLYAHFMDGDKVYENLNALLCQSTFNNLMDSHPYGAGAIFQIDGNFGAAAAMLEMLVQGDGERFRLLPALPKQFSTGSVSGLCLRGGYELSMEWKDQKVTSYEIKRRENTSYDDADKEIEVEVNGKKQVVKL